MARFIAQATRGVRESRGIPDHLRGCEKWTRTLSEPNRTKHIDVAYHHIRDWVKLGKISVVPVEANLQLADALTKALPRPQHEFLMEKYCGAPLAF